MTPTIVDAKHVAERVPLRFAFALEMDVGVTIASVTRTCTLKKGIDTSPAAVLSGAATVNAGTGEVLQLVQGGVGGARYVVVCVATLSNGLVLVRGIELPVIDF